MCPNRVEALESRVQELEASVEGLTDELVECKVRLRELENAIDEDLGFAPVGEDYDGFGEPPETARDQVETAQTADTPKNEAPDEPDNAEESESESESGDIIVA